MNQRIVRMSTMLFTGILILYSSCSGQNTAQVAHSNVHNVHPSIGDTVKELGNNIMVIFQDTKNNHWFGSWVEGLYRYNGQTIIHYTTKAGLCHNRIESIQEDKSGNMFFNTSGGVSKFDGQRFTTLTLTGNSTNAWKLEPHDLWFKGNQDSAAVYRYDGKALYRLEFPKTALGEEFISNHPRSKYPNMKHSPYDVYTIYRDRRGNVWFGTGVLGVCRYDGQSHNWITEDDVTELHDGPANGARSIIEDNDGYFWFSNALFRYKIYPSAAKGLSTAQQDTQDTKVMRYQREKAIDSVDEKIAAHFDLEGYMSVAKDKHGVMWFVTYGAGVWRYDPSTELRTGSENITHYPVKGGNTTITLFSIYKDNHGDLWLGTHETGAYKFNGKTFERFRP